jgi:hypothetical protein
MEQNNREKVLNTNSGTDNTGTDKKELAENAQPELDKSSADHKNNICGLCGLCGMCAGNWGLRD